MKHIERTITIDKPLAKVWNYLSDFTTTTEWDPGTVETRRISGGGGVGTRYLNTSKFLGRETQLEYTVEEAATQSLLRLAGENKTVVSLDTLKFSGDEQSTTVVYRAEFTFKGMAKLVEPLMPLALKKLGDEAEKGMHAALDRL